MSWLRFVADSRSPWEKPDHEQLREVEPDLASGRLVAPRRGPGVCQICFNLIELGRARCRACEAADNHLDAMAPISYSLSGSRLHTELSAYKRDAEPFVRYAVGVVAAILDRFLSAHELCVGKGERFDLVTVVPSSDLRRDQHHQLRRIIANDVPAVAGRNRRLLAPSGLTGKTRAFDCLRYSAVESLLGRRILLIDDTWTTGASAQSAAAVLRDAGASYVAAVVIGRYLNARYADNQARVACLEDEFSWTACALCSSASQTRVCL